MIELVHNGPELLRTGVLAAQNVDIRRYPDGFERALAQLFERRAPGLDAESDAWRQVVRDILRNGKYKPTGRGKPASEYLLRAASEGKFPRINALVDVCNFISLSSLLPVSIWDVERAGAYHFEVRLGREGESYVFNEAGQTIDLQDLVVGCSVHEAGGDSRPIVNPVKDSMETKTNDASVRIAAIVYGRADDGPAGSLEDTCRQFKDLLSGCGDAAAASWAIARAGESIEL